MRPKSKPFVRSASSFPFTLPSVAPRFGGGGARFLALTVLGAAAHFAAPQAQGANLYWDGNSATWNSAGNWSTASDATTPNPGGQPGSSDDLFFNITTVNTNQTITASGGVVARSLNFTSTGTVTIRSVDTTAQTLTFTGDINIAPNAGVVTIGDTTNPLNISMTGNGIWTNNSANTFTVRNDIGQTVQRTLSIAGSGNTTLSGVVSNGSGGKLTLTKTGAGTLTLSNNNNSFTGVTTFTGGIVSVSTISNGSGNSALGAAGSGAGNLVFDGGTLQYTGNSDANTNRAFTINADKSATIDVSTSGRTLRLVGANGTATNGTLTKTGAGTLLLTGINTYTGLTTVSGGALNIRSDGSLASGNALTLGASGKADFANASQNLGAVINANTATNALNFSAATGTVTLASLSGAGNTRFGSDGTVTGGISTGTVTAVGLLTSSISGGTVGAGSLSSSAVSGGTNTITGAAGITSLSNGTTTVGGVATIGTMSAGIANLNGATSSISTLNGGTVNLGSSTVLTVDGGTTSGSITGSGGSLTKSSAGTLVLSGANSYTGTTQVNAGTLSAGNIVVSGSSSNLGNATSAVTLGAAATQGTLSYTGNSATYTRGFTIGGAGGGRLDVTTSGQTLQVDTGAVTGTGLFTVGGAGNTTINTNLTHTGGLTKADAGTVTINSDNSSGGYTGATSVTAGKLIVNGNISTSTTTVSGTGTLGGSGTVGAVIVQAGGTLAPGNSPGNITAASLSLADNANFDIEIDKSLSPTNDRVTLTGNFSNVLAITTGANLNLALTGTFVLGDRFTLADYNTINGTWNGGLFNLGAGTSTLADDSVFQYGSYDWRINYDDLTNGVTNSTESYTDGGKYLTLTVVPEPNVAALIGGFGMLCLLRRRR